MTYPTDRWNSEERIAMGRRFLAVLAQGVPTRAVMERFGIQPKSDGKPSQRFWAAVNAAREANAAEARHQRRRTGTDPRPWFVPDELTLAVARAGREEIQAELARRQTQITTRAYKE